MNFRQPVPDYLTSRKNTIIQIVFTAVFAYIFIMIYRPFSYDTWYETEEWKRLVALGVVVLSGMIVIIFTRLGMFALKKNHEITLELYIFMIVVEIFLLGGFYSALEYFILSDQRSAFKLMFSAVQNTSLILLIPYIISILFFSWKDITRKFNQIRSQFREPSDIFIPFKDEKGVLRITIKSSDLLYLESNDNYVNIHFADKDRKKSYLIRNNLKTLENEFRDYPVYRCHRSFSINIQNVKLVRKAKKGYELVMNSITEDCIPLSASYQKKIFDLLKIR
jgi:DNA-binding LytR/AlgR family response regulator